MSTSRAIDQAIKQFKLYLDNPTSEQHRLSLSLKRELIEVITNDLPAMPKRQLMACQGTIIGQVISLCHFGCGASLLRALLNLVVLIYTHGDFTKMQGEFFEAILSQLGGAGVAHGDKKGASQTSGGHFKINSCFLMSKVFEQLWLRCHSPPTKELIECLFKLAKNSSERQIKEGAFKGIKCIVKANPSNFHTFSVDYLKNIQKAIQSCDKSPENAAAKGPMVACLRVFIERTLNYSSLYTHFETLLATCIKGFEDTNQGVTEEYIRICFSLFNLRLQEAQQQGDIRTTFRVFNQQLKEANKKKTGGSSSSSVPCIDVPRTLNDVLSFLSAVLLKIQAPNPQASQTMDNMRYAVSQVLARLIEANRLHLEGGTDSESLLTPLLLSCNYSPMLVQGKAALVADPETTCKQRDTVSWLLSQVAPTMQRSERAGQMMRACLQSLSQRQIVGMSKESLDTFSGFCKNMKVSSMLVESQSTVLIRLLTDIAYYQEPQSMQVHFGGLKEVQEPLLQLLKDSNVRFYAIEAIKVLSARYPQHWLHEAVEQLLTLTTNAHADLSTMRWAPIYSNIHSSANGQETLTLNTVGQAYYSQLQLLNTYSIALAVTMQGMQRGSGVPLTLASAVFEASKSMILGGTTSSREDDESLYQLDLQLINLQDQQRRAAGWTLLEGLLALGNQWLGTRLSTIFKLFNSVFSKEMCTIASVGHLKDPGFLEKVLSECAIKRAALSTLRTFLQRGSVLLNTQLWKLVGTFLIQAVTFLLNHDKDKRDLQSAFKQHFTPEALKQVRSDLFECLLQLPSTSLYSAKFVHLLHSVCEEIVAEDHQSGLNCRQAVRKLIHFEDLNDEREAGCKFRAIATRDFLKTYRATIGSLEHVQVGFENDLINYLLRLDNSASMLTFEEFNQATSESLLSNSILLFGEIFSSQQLNIKNKQQLLKHFLVHSTAATPQPSKDPKKPPPPALTQGKVQKLLQIMLATLSVCKMQVKKGTSELLDHDMELQIQQIFKNCEHQVTSAFPREQRLLMLAIGEGIVHLKVPHILKDPERELDSLLREQEGTLQQLQKGQDESNKRSRIISTLGSVCRYLDFETLLSPIQDRILKAFVALGKNTSMQSLSRELYLHHCHLITKHLSQEFPAFFQNLFQTCFHQMQSDVKVNSQVLASLGGMLQAQLKCDLGSTMENRRAATALNEYVHLILLGRGDTASKWGPQVISVSLDIAKTLLIIDIDSIIAQLQSIISLCVGQLQNQTAYLSVKQKSLEFLAAAVYKGYIHFVKEASVGPKSELSTLQLVTSLISEALNLSLSVECEVLAEQRVRKRLNLCGVREIMTNNDEFEKLINFKQHNYLQNERVLSSFGSHQEREAACVLLYQHGLQVFYVMCFKVLAGTASTTIQELIDATKFLIQYKHQPVAIQGQEESKKAEGGGAGTSQLANITVKLGQTFSFELNDTVRYLSVKNFKNFIKHLCTVDVPSSTCKYQSPLNKLVDLRKHLGQLISLAFSIISSDSTLLKKAGFSLTLVLVKKFRTCIEQMRDEEDDEGASAQMRNQQRLRAYRENPLLLEQYEAQIFTIIRQNLSFATTHPSVVARNYKLIKYFLTIPICKDNSIVGKIFTQLIGDDVSDIFSASTHQYEKSVSDLHFKKLKLIAKILIAASCKPNEEFKSPHTNQKSIKEALEKTDDLPSKFMHEDKARILEALANQLMSIFMKQVSLALSDIMIISTMPKQSLKNMKHLNFIRGGVHRSAYCPDTLESTLPYLVKLVSLNPIASYQQKLSESDWVTVQGLIIHILSQPLCSNQQNKKGNPDDQAPASSLIEAQLRAKITYLDLLLTFSQSYYFGEIELYQGLMTYLHRFGVTEISTRVLKFYCKLISKEASDTNQGLVSDLYDKSLQSLISIQPEIVSAKKTQDFSENELELIRTIIDCLAIVKQKTTGQLIGKSLISIIISKIPSAIGQLGNIDSANSLQAIKLYQGFVLQVLKTLDGTFDDIVESSTLKLMKEMNESPIMLTKATQVQLVIACSMLMHMTVQSLEITDFLATNIFSLSRVESNPLLLPTIIKVLSAQIPQDSSHPVVLYEISLQLAYDILKPCAVQQPIPEAHSSLLTELLAFIISVCYAKLPVYQNATVSATKIKALENILLAIFTVIQAKASLPAQIRNAQVETVYTLFTLDGLCFKHVLTNVLNAPEWTLVENIFRQITAAKQAQAVKAGQTQSSSGPSKPTSKDGTGGSIALSMNFKRK